MKIPKRIEYLSLASANAKSHSASELNVSEQATVEFLSDLDEKLEVAYVQLAVFEAMKNVDHLSEDGARAVEVLGTALLDITTVRSPIPTEFYPTSCEARHVVSWWFSYITNMQTHMIYTISNF
jgi:hypothetical protein